MKKITTLCCSLLCVGAFSASAEGNKPIKIGVLQAQGKDNAYMWSLYQAMQNKAQKMKGVTLESYVANRDHKLQEEQISKLINSKVDVVIAYFVKNQKGVKKKNQLFRYRMLDKLKNAKIPVVINLSKVKKHTFYDHQNTYFVGTVPAQSAIYQGEAVIEGWKNHPKWDLNNDGVIQYALIRGPATSNTAKSRAKWVAATINNYPGKGIDADKIVSEAGDWKEDLGKSVVEEWLTNGLQDKIEIYIASNDSMALGAAAALKARGLKRPVYGVDGLPTALQSIQKGEMTSTVIQSVDLQSTEVLNLAVNIARGKPLEANSKYKVVEREMIIPFIAVDKSNVKNFIK